MANAIVFGWNRSIPGREVVSAEHFTQFIGYLTNLKTNSTITSFDTVFMNPGGGMLNGLILIQGESEKLHRLTETTEWLEHITRASLHLENLVCNLAVTGNEIMNRMSLWTKSIPAK